jgi:hypothetical protein
LGGAAATFGGSLGGSTFGSGGFSFGFSGGFSRTITAASVFIFLPSIPSRAAK